MATIVSITNTTAALLRPKLNTNFDALNTELVAATAAVAAKADASATTSALAGKAATSHTHAATDITSGVLAPERLAAGTGLQVLRRNSGNTALEFATVSVGAGDLLAANNLSDIANAATARLRVPTTSSSGGNGNSNSPSAPKAPNPTPIY